MTIIQGTKKVLSAIGIRNIKLIVETKSEEQNDILFVGVLHVSSLFINLIFSSELLKRGYYLHCGNQIINPYTNNAEIVSALIQDRLFILKLYKRSKKWYNLPFTLSVKVVISHAITLI